MVALAVDRSDHQLCAALQSLYARREHLERLQDTDRERGEQYRMATLALRQVAMEIAATEAVARERGLLSGAH